MSVREHLRALLSPSARFQLRLWLTQLRRLVAVWAWWRWRTVCLSESADAGGVHLTWRGRVSEQKAIQRYFRLPHASRPSDALAGGLWQGLRVTECWMPGAWKVPLFLEASIDTGPSWSQVRASLGATVQKIQRRSEGKYQFRQVDREAEILDLEQRMIRPFAERHGEDTSQFDSGLLMRYALGHAQGRFVAMASAGQVVGCGFGFASFPGGVKTWNACRFGCAPAVFNDRKWLEEVNTQNVLGTVEWAQQAGYASVNLGVSFGPPDSGLIQWKCRRGAYPDPSAMSLFVYLRVPPTLRSTFFWQHPVFVMEGKQVTLLAGVAPGAALADILHTFKPLAYRRMTAFKVHCATDFPADHRDAIVTMLVQQGLDCPVVWVDNSV